ncbi:MAG: NAD(P)-dependent dehydrogenase (short-subunit alcohol dehydrogenase family) [Crocinitomicaceae bacterium]|jgi:NAD(P)-dependent dehydrogenase (short-subunit alcohol dehydrogenase family)
MDTPFHLHGKTILITGASSGIGKQIAISVSEMGAKVIATGRDQQRLEETVSSLKGEGHQAVSTDLLLEEQRLSMVKNLPVLNGVVHCAGVVKPYPIQFLNQKKIDETLNINYEIPVLLMSAITAKKKLEKNASIVFLSSISGQHPHKGGAMYAGSKAALEAFSKVLALELYSKGIRSNCISPGMVKTAMYYEAEEGMSKESMDEHVAQYPLGIGCPTDVANTATFLLSDASRWITGINITLDGGFLLGK